MSGAGLFYWQEMLGKTIPHQLTLSWTITAAKTVSPTIQGLPVLTAFDAIASQAVIDNYLGTTNEFLLAQFDATAMGTDAFAGIVNMKGQAFSAMSMEIVSYSGANGATAVPEGVVAVSTLTSSSLSTQYAVGANGNLAFRAVIAGLDALTSGQILAKLYWLAK